MSNPDRHRFSFVPFIVTAGTIKVSALSFVFKGFLAIIFPALEVQVSLIVLALNPDHYSMIMFLNISAVLPLRPKTDAYGQTLGGAVQVQPLGTKP